ncbi:MAG: tandem-95 repeat protein [Proteobacteria bacterium]|nr:tandem-95 repeat protein [Pseudomonadota bacterium]
MGDTTNIGTVNVVITEANDDPVANNDTGGVFEGNSVTINLTNNDQDIDGTIDDSTIDVTTDPTYGTLVDNDDGTVTYTHDGTENFSDTFQYQVQDDDGAWSNSATVTITITEVNDAPVANDDSASDVAFAGTVTIDLDDNDTDVDNSIDVTSIVITTDPTYGKVVDNGDGTVDYTHNGYTAYSDSFQYTIDDELGATSNTATVTVSINEPGGGHGTEEFIEDGSYGQWCGGGALVHYKDYGSLTFDECQAQANATGTQWYVGSNTALGNNHGWIGDHDETQATISTSSWGTEAVVDRNLLYPCVLAKVDHYSEPDENPTAEYYTDDQGRDWTYWQLANEKMSQALAFADDRDARIINPNSVGLTGQAGGTPTHWCWAAAMFNSTGGMNGDTPGPFVIGYYEPHYGS